MRDYNKILEERKAICVRKKKNQKLIFEIDIENGYKFCKYCNQNKPLDDFNLQLTKEFPLFFNKCKICGGFKGKPIFININGTELKKCSKCKEYKEYSNFGINKHKRKGIEGKCKICQLLHGRTYRENNKERLKENNRESRKRNVLKIKERKKIYNEKPINKERLNRKRRERYKHDLNFKLLLNLRGRMTVMLRGLNKSDTTQNLLGCTIDEFKAYLSSQFDCNMNWDNYGINGWELEHILPCELFNLIDERQQRVCFNYKNLKPLWHDINRSKQDKLDNGRFARDMNTQERLDYLKSKGYDFTNLLEEPTVSRPISS